MNIKNMTQDVISIFEQYQSTGTNNRNYHTASFDLVYQVGMLIKRIQQLENNRFREGMQNEQIKLLIGDELADIIAEVLFVAHELDIDISRSRQDMLSSDVSKISSRKS